MDEISVFRRHAAEKAKLILRLFIFAFLGFCVGIAFCLLFYPLLPFAPLVSSAGLIVGLVFGYRK